MSDTTGIRSTQIKTADKHGTQTYVQMSDGTGTSGDLAAFDATGSVKDAGFGTPIPVNKGGTGASAPSLVAGSNVTITGSWPNQTIAASGGTVTSVALSMPTEFSVSGSPITGSGTLTVTKANESANTVFAGPSSGSAATPTFRALVVADLPSQPYDVVCSLVGKPSAGATVLLLTFTRAVTFAGNFSGSYGTVGTNPTATATYTVSKNGSSIGSAAISTSGVFTFTTTSGASQSFAAGDRLLITAPGTQDTTLSDVAMTFAGTR